jgi:hypothetical protein
VGLCSAKIQFDERWSTFVRNHAESILACDFFVTVTANFRLLYVFVIMEIGSAVCS